MAHMCGCGGQCGDGPCLRYAHGVRCWSRGPRIGTEGVPFCKLEAGHEGLHTASEEDGWKNIQWGKPDMIAWNLRQEDSQKLNVEEQLKSLTVLAKSWGYDEAAEVITIICERMSFNMDG